MGNRNGMVTIRLISIKRLFLLIAIALLLVGAIVSCQPAFDPTVRPSTSPEPIKVLRIGYQKFNTLNFLKSRGSLEKALQPLGISVQWNEFATGPLLLEALNAGSLDFGHAADTPPIIAQSAGVPFVYVAQEPPYPKGVALVVRKTGALRTIQDLQGKKVATGRGWNAFNLIIRALEKEGLTLAAIQPVFVATAADAQAAFEQGSVDAFGVWDPFYAVVERTLNVKPLVDGTGIVSNPTFYLAAPAFAREQAQLIKTILIEIKLLDEWANANPRAVAELLAPQLKVDVADLERATRRRQYGVQPITETTIAEQQQIADTFFRLKLIPRAIAVKDAVLSTGF